MSFTAFLWLDSEEMLGILKIMDYTLVLKFPFL